MGQESDTRSKRAWDWIDISVRRRCELRRPGIRFRGRPSLAPDDLVLRDDIPVTSPLQTLVDLTTELDVLTLERAVNDADKRDLINPEALRENLTRSRLPMPLTQQRVNEFEVDFFWPDLGLVVETDGLRYHRTPSAQLRDARRDRAHVMAGMTPLRFTHYEVRYEPNRVRAALVKTIAMLRKRIRF